MNIKLTEDELYDQFQKQICFLINSSNYFDLGIHFEAIRLSTALRILLHDTDKSKSKSLLKQLGMRTYFFDTSINADKLGNENTLPIQMPETSLISFLQGNPIHTYKPHFNNSPNIVKKDFDDWWEQIVIQDMKGNQFSRKTIVLAVANKDGGAHVDPDLDHEYYELTRLNSAGHLFSKNIDTSKGFSKTIEMSQLSAPTPSPIIVYCTLRQIAHELIISRIDPDNGPIKLNSVYLTNPGLYDGLATSILGLY